MRVSYRPWPGPLYRQEELRGYSRTLHSALQCLNMDHKPCPLQSTKGVGVRGAGSLTRKEFLGWREERPVLHAVDKASMKCTGTQEKKQVMTTGRISHMGCNLSSGSGSGGAAVKVCSHAALSSFLITHVHRKDK